jgi:hypothetical protein
VTEFAALSAQAQEAGTKVGIEFLPWSNIKTIHDGLRLVEDADHEAGGLIIDVWHTERAHTRRQTLPRFRSATSSVWRSATPTPPSWEPSSKISETADAFVDKGPSTCTASLRRYAPRVGWGHGVWRFSPRTTGNSPYEKPLPARVARPRQSLA